MNSSREEESMCRIPGDLKEAHRQTEQGRPAEVGYCYLGEEGWSHGSSWALELSKHRLNSDCLTLCAALSSVLTSVDLSCKWMYLIAPPLRVLMIK